MKKYLFVCFLCIFSTLFAQTDDESTISEKDTIDLSDMSIEELSKLKSRYKATEIEKMVTQAIVAASRKPISLKKSPSIVSVITADDIEKSGARDIIDVFRLVPGIDFHVDVQGAVGMSFRGLWAYEGKILVLLDGQEMNETAYSTVVFGNNYNISQIKKIEVIRGPGSAIYGGYAEYAVINIITKSAEEINGLQTKLLIGQAVNTYARQNFSLSVGKKINDLSFSLSTFFGRGQRSNSIYQDIDGHSFSMVGNSDLNPTNFNLGLGYKALSVRLIYDMLATTTRDGYIKLMSKAYSNNFTTSLTEIKYSPKISPTLTIQAKFNYKRSIPWEFKEKALVSDDYPSYQIIADRYRGNVAAIWDAKYWLNVTVGTEIYLDKAQKPILDKEIQLFRNDDISQVSYLNYAAFMQSLIKSRFANLTIGARYDLNSASGAAFSPRLGITKKTGPFYFKLLYAHSYRAPGIENIQTSINKQIFPEKSITTELESSYQINRNMFLSISLYDIVTRHSIRYAFDTTFAHSPDGYINSMQKTGSQGIDIEYKYKSSMGFINLAYSYYTVGNKGVDAANAVSINRRASLGIPNHKLTLLTNVNVGRFFYISPSVNFLGKRYGYNSIDTWGNLILHTYQPQLQVNVYVGANNLLPGFTFGMGVYNMTNQEVLYLQPYNGAHGEYPGMGTEIIFNLTYKIQFKEKEAL